MPKSSQMAPNLRRSFAALWRALSRDLADPYRPELHYMRGPGPKWHAKHGREATEEISVSELTEATA
jgi:hypothetical protein